ncbi:hypothetical protein JT358_08795 [Micrococcales bacterium 31B]|nr:hypothetical protein [Micrococcales bacterium 31B]
MNFRSRISRAVAAAMALCLLTTGFTTNVPDSSGSQEAVRAVDLAELRATGASPNPGVPASAISAHEVQFGDDGDQQAVLTLDSGADAVIVESHAAESFGMELPSDTKNPSLTVAPGGAALLENETFDVAVTAHDSGAIQARVLIESSQSPRQYPFTLDLAAGVQPVLAADGGVDFMQVHEGDATPVLVARLEAPWAVDAAGAPVQTHYEIRGDQVIQHVQHGPQNAYPVVADPFWIPAIIVGIRVATIVIKVGSKTVKYTKAPASRVVNALGSFRQLTFKAGAHTFRLDKSAMTHVLKRHHPQYWDGSTKATQTFFNPSMSVAGLRDTIHVALKQGATRLKAAGTNKRVEWTGTANGVNYKIVVDKGRVVQFYPR